MATYTWSGTGNASTTTNWTPNGTPGASDTVVFGASGGNCNFDLASVLVISSTGTPSYTVTFANSVSGIKAFTHNFAITAGSAINLSFAGTATLSSGTRYIDIGSNASITNPQNITYVIDATSTAGVRFDGGTYPNVDLQKGQMSFQYSAPTVTTNTTVSFRNLTLGANLNTADQALSPVSPSDEDMVFHITGTLTNNVASFNGGRGKWVFEGAAAPGIVLPVCTSTFQSKFRSIEILASGGVGRFATIPDGSFLMLEELSVANGAALRGDGSAIIFCSNNPTIKGTWNFTQASPGIYTSKKRTFVVGVGHGGTGLTGLGTAGQVLKVNSGANALEYGTVSASVDIDALAALGGTGLHQTQDHFIFSDNGTEKKITFSNLEDAIFANVSGDATIAAGGALTIGTGVVEHAMLDDDAVDGDNIADDSINSEHYVDGSIDTAHIGDDQVTYAKIQNVSATDRILGRDSSGAGVIEEITPANLRTMINVADGATAYADANAQQASLGVALTAVSLATSVSGFTSGAYTIAPMTNVIKDVTSSWDASNYCFTAPAAGIFQVSWSASIRYITTSHSVITRLQKDTGSGYALLAAGNTANDSGAISGGTWTGSLASGDKIALYVYHNGGSGKNLIGDSVAANFTHMGIRMVGLP
tara:strand:+ start:2360 stop:4303 length:1944 start_codon:yes stop_codon:yes gene_type:complete